MNEAQVLTFALDAFIASQLDALAGELDDQQIEEIRSGLDAIEKNVSLIFDRSVRPVEPEPPVRTPPGQNR